MKERIRGWLNLETEMHFMKNGLLLELGKLCVALLAQVLLMFCGELSAGDNVAELDVVVPEGGDPDDYYLEVKNDTSSTIKFNFKLNGHFSLNNAELVEMIRAMPEAYKGEPDYVKAWRYVRDHRYHSAPLCGQYYQHDPSFFMNCMGFGLCDDAACVTATIWRNMGYESRVWGLGGHVVPEIKINNRWELYDPDLMVIYYKKNGDVAGVEDLAKNPALVKNPLKKTPGHHYGAYCENVKNIYVTTKNNSMGWEKGMKTHFQRDFIFTLPSRTTLSMGAVFYHKDLKIYGKKAAKRISHARLSIPAHWSGTLDIPLFVHTILGDKNDSVTIKGTKFGVDSTKLEEYLDRRAIPGGKSLGTQPAPIKIEDNKHPIEIIYLVNPFYTKLKEVNKLCLTGQGADGLTASLKLKNPQSLLGDWKLDDGKGRTAMDSGPNEATAALIDNVEWSDAGTKGGALRFNGPKGALELRNCQFTDRFKPGKSFTVQLWFKPDATEIKREALFSAFTFDIDLRGDKILVYYRNATGKNTSIWGKKRAKIGEWNRITVTYASIADNKALLSLYLNGKPCGSKTSLTISVKSQAKGPFVGYTPNGGGYYFMGLIDDVKIWSKALTPAEIADRK